MAAVLVIMSMLPNGDTVSSAQTLKDARRQRHASKMAPDLSEQLEQSGTEAVKRVIVQLSQTAVRNSLPAKLARFGGHIHQSHDAVGLTTIEIPAGRVRELAADSDVAYLSPDRPVAATGHLETTTGAVLVRDLVNGTTLDGRGIGIAVIDSGIYSNHYLLTGPRKELEFKIKDLTKDCSKNLTPVSSPVRYEQSFVNGECSADDIYGHGTHVASLIRGSADFGDGDYSGIAPAAELLNLRVLDDQGRGSISRVIAAIDWCMANQTTYNIRVINLSLGAPAMDSYQNDPLCLAARRAYNAGIVVVAAAGNHGKDQTGRKLYGGISSPGIDPSVITVGATNTLGTDRRSDDQMATFSSRGPTRGFVIVNGVRKYDNLIKPDLVAPGNRLIGAQSLGKQIDNWDGSLVYTNSLVREFPALRVADNQIWLQGKDKLRVIPEGTMYLSGTSLAAPLVSGTVALMLQTNPRLTPGLVKAILMYSAQPLKGFNTLEQGAGQLNVDGAVRLARLVRSNAALLANGAPMLNGSLPDQQASTIGGEICYWGEGVMTNYCFLHGRSLMTRWQGMYSRSVLLADATGVVNGALQQLPGLTSPGVLNSSGIVFADGGSLADDVLIASGIVFADGTVYPGGIVFADGRIIADFSTRSVSTVKSTTSFLGDLPTR